MKIKTTATLLAVALLCSAQPNATIVNQTGGPPPTPAWISKFFNDGTNVTYECRAMSIGALTQYKRTDSTLTSIVDSGTTGTVNATAHNLYAGAYVTVSGATVDTDLNGSYVVKTVPDANSFTITTASVGDTTYTESTLVVSTNNPRLDAAVWAIKVFRYDTTFPDLVKWAKGAVWPQNLKCTERANY